MKNNKGFSLVELIIVIAIMAILVGVMAPQLIKYIEKTNQASDVQLCDSVKTAVTTGYMDPAVAKVGETIDDGTYAIEDLWAQVGSASDDMRDAVREILGTTGDADTAMNGKIKSKLGKTGSVSVVFEEGAIDVYIDAIDGTITTRPKN